MLEQTDHNKQENVKSLHEQNQNMGREHKQTDDRPRHRSELSHSVIIPIESLGLSEEEREVAELKDYLRRRQINITKAMMYHQYLTDRYNKIFLIFLFVNVGLSFIISVMGGLHKDEGGNSSTTPIAIVSAINAGLMVIMKGLNIHEKPALHRNSRMMAEELANEIEHDLIRVGSDYHGLQTMSDVYMEKIKAFRTIECEVPFRIKNMKIFKDNGGRERTSIRP